MVCESVLADQFAEITGQDDMAWTKPLNSRGRVDLAGDVISGRKTMVPEMDLDAALDVAGNWRSSHGYPLSVMFESLRRRPEKLMTML